PSATLFSQIAKSSVLPPTALSIRSATEIPMLDLQRCCFAHSFSNHCPLATLDVADNSVEALWQAMQAARIVHITAHAEFNMDNPLQSYIKLGDSRLTALNILSLPLLQETDIVFLSSCSSSKLSDDADQKEAFGLHTALL